MFGKKKVYKDAAEWKLIQRCKEGDREAFDELFNKYHQRIFNSILYFFGDVNESQDICQEVFINGYQSIKNFRGDSNLFTWLYRIAVNLVKNKFKQRALQKRVITSNPVNEDGKSFIEEVAAKENSEQDAEKRELMQAIQSALMGLEEDKRMALVLREIDGLSYEEIAKILRISEGTVKSRIARGRGILQKNLKSFL